ncbi:hypothetical protein NP493_1035g00000 [Ridgeia piscesae]|uniref:Uncharacterized protein n=1 Tax=Ridgeia piscesae TaxID=27915 RepID=A0AAD9KIF1_RIDPI|nr:hypothetical protein NP493_1035g00000 [Ridgeia piscesae]
MLRRYNYPNISHIHSSKSKFKNSSNILQFTHGHSLSSWPPLMSRKA